MTKLKEYLDMEIIYYEKLKNVYLNKLEYDEHDEVYRNAYFTVRAKLEILYTIMERIESGDYNE